MKKIVKHISTPSHLTIIANDMSAGRYDLAIAGATKLLNKEPKNFHALFLMGSAQLSIGLFSESVVSLNKAIQIRPSDASALNNLGSAYSALGNIDDAIANYSKSISADSTFSAAHFNLGNGLMNLGKWHDAVTSFTNAIEQKTDYPQAYGNLGICLIKLKKYDDAIFISDFYIDNFGINAIISINKCKALFEKGLKAGAIKKMKEYSLLAPESSELYSALADMCVMLMRPDEAIQYFKRAIEINPLEYANYNNLAALMFSLGQKTQALEIYERAAKANPRSATPHQNIAGIHIQDQDFGLALRYLNTAYELGSTSPYILGMIAHAKVYCCEWEGIDTLIDKIQSSVPINTQVSNPFPPIAYLDNQKYLTKVAADWSSAKYPESNFFPAFQPRGKGGKLRVGYFSADFHGHATSLLIAGLLEQHDKSKFETFGFSFGPDSNDELSNRVRQTFDHFIDIKSLSDRAVAAYAREVGLDIAIDLKGFTQNSRTAIFAERVAPIQINYLGFPGSMGTAYIDYIVADDYVIPHGCEQDYTEQVLRLPHCYQPNDRLRPIATTVYDRVGQGLPEDAVVLCSFNNNYKITPAVFDIWMRVLGQFPSAVLWLLKDTDIAEANLRKEAQSRGIDSSRLVFAPRLSPPEHLARHQCADLFLDTYPCNAHTTASDALWANLPLVTCSGNSFASRVAGSLLTNVGLANFITTNLLDYENRIVSLLSNPAEIAAARTHLTEKKLKLPLFDTKQHAANWQELLIYVMSFN